MSLTLKENANTFLPAPEGLHIARCYALIDLGKQFNKFYGNNLPKILIGWELTDKLMENRKPYIQFQRYTASLNEKSSLRSLLEAWRGRGFMPEELDGFELKNVLGATCYLTTKHVLNPTTQQRWSKVISICPLPNYAICPAPINPTICFDLDDYNESDYLAVPEGIRKIINLTDLKPSTSQMGRIADRVTFHPVDQEALQPDTHL